MKSTVTFFLLFLLFFSLKAAAQLNIPSQQVLLYPESFFIRRPDVDREEDFNKKEISLTFDDGPDPENTEFILDILREKEVKATFFLLGKKVAKYPELVKKIYQEGHQIGNHSWTHRNFQYLDDFQILKEEIFPASELIAELTGTYPVILRPPYGIINNKTIELLSDKQWKIVMWSIDPYDWRFEAEEIIRRTKRYSHPGGIILLHCTGENTVEALPVIIDFLLAEGYIFRRIDELLF